MLSLNINGIREHKNPNKPRRLAQGSRAIHLICSTALHSMLPSLHACRKISTHPASLAILSVDLIQVFSIRHFYQASKPKSFAFFLSSGPRDAFETKFEPQHRGRGPQAMSDGQGIRPQGKPGVSSSKSLVVVCPSISCPIFSRNCFLRSAQEK